MGQGVPLVYECCKFVGGTTCGLGVGVGGPFSVCVLQVGGWYSLWVGGRGWGEGGPFSVCCKLVGGTPCGLGVRGSVNVGELQKLKGQDLKAKETS